MWGFAPVPDADLFSSGMSDETGTARAGALKDNAVIQPLEAARLSLSISMIRRPGVMEEDADAEGELATQNAEGSRSHPEVAVGSLPSSSCRRAHAGPDSARPPSMPECLWSGHLRHNETLRRELASSAERLGVAEHTFPKHSERHAAELAALRNSHAFLGSGAAAAKPGAP